MNALFVVPLVPRKTLTVCLEPLPAGALNEISWVFEPLSTMEGALSGMEMSKVPTLILMLLVPSHNLEKEKRKSEKVRESQRKSEKVREREIDR